MRSLNSASSSWQDLKQYHTLTELKQAIRLDGRTSTAATATTSLRSMCWKAFLLFESVEADEWPRALLSSRSAYNSLRLHFLRRLEDPDDGDADFDLLGEGGAEVCQLRSSTFVERESLLFLVSDPR